MLEKAKLDRINELVRKERTDGLTTEEKAEQQSLRDEYITAFRSGMRNQIEGLKIVDEEGTDVTPDKLKDIQREKGLHNRSSE